MENFDFTNLFIWAGLILGGYLFGILDGKFSTWFKKEREEQAEKAEETKKAATEEHAALRVLIDPGLKARLELDGLPLAPSEMSPEQRKRLINLIVQIRPWIDGAAPATSSTPAPASAKPAMSPPAQRPIASAPVAPTPIMLAPEPTAPRIDIIRGLRGVVVDGTLKKDSSAPKSLVGMINDILQEKLENSQFAGKPISMEDGPGGAVIVVVGTQRYDGISSVPDPDLQAFIRSAVAEWEKRSG